MATPTSSSFDLLKFLTKVDKFSDSDQLERLRLLATAIVPYGTIENSTVIEVYKKLQATCGENAKPIITRLMDKASFRQDFIVQLKTMPACETANIPLLYFTELLIDISDDLGNGEYLRRLKNRIPDSQLGSSRDRITTAVQLFQQLLLEQTLSFNKEIESLTLLTEWLGDIGRRDIANKVEKEKETKLNTVLKPNQENTNIREESTTEGVVPVSECTQETTRFTSDEGLNDEPSNRPTDINEESSETETHLGV